MISVACVSVVVIVRFTWSRRPKFQFVYMSVHLVNSLTSSVIKCYPFWIINKSQIEVSNLLVTNLTTCTPVFVTSPYQVSTDLVNRNPIFSFSVSPAKLTTQLHHFYASKREEMAATDNKAVDVEAGTTKQQVVYLQVDSRWAFIKKVYSIISMQLLVWKLSMVYAWFSCIK